MRGLSGLSRWKRLERLDEGGLIVWTGRRGLRSWTGGRGFDEKLERLELLELTGRVERQDR